MDDERRGDAGVWRVFRSAADAGRNRSAVGGEVCAAVGCLGGWRPVAFRIVNIPRFAEFLISVENEMGKVSWPSRRELFQASMVVIVVIFMLTAILLGYDLALNGLFPVCSASRAAMRAVDADRPRTAGVGEVY